MLAWLRAPVDSTIRAQSGSRPSLRDLQEPAAQASAAEVRHDRQPPDVPVVLNSAGPHHADQPPIQPLEELSSTSLRPVPAESLDLRPSQACHGGQVDGSPFPLVGVEHLQLMQPPLDQVEPYEDAVTAAVLPVEPTQR